MDLRGPTSKGMDGTKGERKRKEGSERGKGDGKGEGREREGHTGTSLISPLRVLLTTEHPSLRIQCCLFLSAFRAKGLWIRVYEGLSDERRESWSEVNEGYKLLHSCSSLKLKEPVTGSYWSFHLFRENSKITDFYTISKSKVFSGPRNWSTKGSIRTGPH